jgi:hypothetical protein
MGMQTMQFLALYLSNKSEENLLCYMYQIEPYELKILTLFFLKFSFLKN